MKDNAWIQRMFIEAFENHSEIAMENLRLNRKQAIEWAKAQPNDKYWLWGYRLELDQAKSRF